ncbi:MAG: hypothetical protein A3H29_16525 [Acidobacteria bacterium RIFCSPLOWO2_02_FULL_67_21]|nr:MAG: hypothetical protein A3H29_16525 [Acidobacteria bacterium RIFCSPLOWO2_02_FULL_67_21]
MQGEPGGPRRSPHDPCGNQRFDSDVIVGVGRGFDYEQNLNASDPDGESLAYEFSQLVTGTPDYGPASRLPGITLDQFGTFRVPAAATSTLLDNPANPAADYMEKFVVSDSSGAFAEREILVDAVNRFLPLLDAIGNRTVDAGDVVTFTVTGHAAGSGASALFLRASGLPPGATFTPGGRPRRRWPAPSRGRPRRGRSGRMASTSRWWRTTPRLLSSPTASSSRSSWRQRICRRCSRRSPTSASAQTR